VGGLTWLYTAISSVQELESADMWRKSIVGSFRRSSFLTLTGCARLRCLLGRAKDCSAIPVSQLRRQYCKCATYPQSRKVPKSLTIGAHVIMHCNLSVRETTAQPLRTSACKIVNLVGFYEPITLQFLVWKIRLLSLVFDVMCGD
jgi:hypothetical protein